MTTATPRSCLVYGPVGCGKSTNAEAIAKALGLHQVLDNWEPGKPAPLLGTLLLSTQNDPNWHFKGRTMTFIQAMQIVHQQRVLA